MIVVYILYCVSWRFGPEKSCVAAVRLLFRVSRGSTLEIVSLLLNPFVAVRYLPQTQRYRPLACRWARHENTGDTGQPASLV